MYFWNAILRDIVFVNCIYEQIYEYVLLMLDFNEIFEKKIAERLTSTFGYNN